MGARARKALAPGRHHRPVLGPILERNRRHERDLPGNGIRNRRSAAGLARHQSRLDWRARGTYSHTKEAAAADAEVCQDTALEEARAGSQPGKAATYSSATPPLSDAILV